MFAMQYIGLAKIRYYLLMGFKCNKSAKARGTLIVRNYLDVNRNIGTIISSKLTPPCWNVLR
jgi:hypothetical protein